ncbi:hypothetical protein FH972_002614 [Carpinus fangiana]|uniref:Uncharacterized protein n=1 Tax=Carpinus fangiana TaxID=176857 RepID=A0A5N6QFY3_9ROSI|nr:hypothetical protein FH972_002614 [Carpinus fangiana]
MSTIFTHLCQLFQKFLPQPVPVPVPVPPQDDVEAGALQALDLEVLHNNDLEAGGSGSNGASPVEDDDESSSVPVPVPPQVDVEAGDQPSLDLEVLYNNVVNFCLVSAPAIALTYAQIHSEFSTTFHVVSFGCVLCFASFFVSKFIKPMFPAIARALEGVGVFFAVTAFFITITIPFPLWLQIMTWLLYAISFLAILVATLF